MKSVSNHDNLTGCLVTLGTNRHKLHEIVRRAAFSTVCVDLLRDSHETGQQRQRPMADVCIFEAARSTDPGLLGLP